MPRTIDEFYKMYVNWTDDPKVSSLSRFGAVDGLLAAHLFSLMIAYARRNHTDGRGPGQEPARMLYPLDAERANRLAEYLADPGDYGPLVELAYANGNADRNADGNADGNADRNAGRILQWRVLNYAKWNDTSDEIARRKAAGRDAALARWQDVPGQGGWTPSGVLDGRGSDADRNADRNAESVQSREREETTARAPGRARARAGAGARDASRHPSYSGLDPVTQRRADLLRTGQTPLDVDVSDDPHARADEARKALANRPAVGPDRPDDGLGELHGQALARAQLAEAAAARARDQTGPAGPADDDEPPPEPDDDEPPEPDADDHDDQPPPGGGEYPF